MTGAIDPADDIDIFSVKPAAGELWEWKLAPKGTALAPHVTVFVIVKTFSPQPGPVNPSVSSGSSSAPVATTRTS